MEKDVFVLPETLEMARQQAEREPKRPVSSLGDMSPEALAEPGGGYSPRTLTNILIGTVPFQEQRESAKHGLELFDRDQKAGRDYIDACPDEQEQLELTAIMDAARHDFMSDTALEIIGYLQAEGRPPADASELARFQEIALSEALEAGDLWASAQADQTPFDPIAVLEAAGAADAAMAFNMALERMKDTGSACEEWAVAALPNNMEKLATIEQEGGPEALIRAFEDGMTHWGKADSAYVAAPGIYSITTGSHGGYYLSPERYAQMPEQLKRCSLSKDRFFEEDCAVCAVQLTFPMETESWVNSALDTYDEYFRDELGPLDPAFIMQAKLKEAAGLDAPQPEALGQQNLSELADTKGQLWHGIPAEKEPAGLAVDFVTAETRAEGVTPTNLRDHFGRDR